MNILAFWQLFFLEKNRRRVTTCQHGHLRQAIGRLKMKEKTSKACSTFEVLDRETHDFQRVVAK